MPHGFKDVMKNEDPASEFSSFGTVNRIHEAWYDLKLSYAFCTFVADDRHTCPIQAITLLPVHLTNVKLTERASRHSNGI